MTGKRNIYTLEEFRKQELRELPRATGELSNLLRDIALAAKRVNVEVNKAGLIDIIGETGSINVQGEKVQILDEFANNAFISVLRRGISCCGVVSEEVHDFIAFDDPMSRQSKYVVVMDPLDGSSNIDVNISIGTIFGIYRRKTAIGSACEIQDFLQKGADLIAAGYIIYGSSTMMVYATRRGVNGFTLDPTIGEFTLSHPDIKFPESGNSYSVNYGNYLHFDPVIQAYISECQKRKDTNGSPYVFRYVGSLVADMHRILLKGGIFLYPGTLENKKGKLRLLYECNPFAFIMKMCGGEAGSGIEKILDIQPVSIHERTPFFAGSPAMMKRFIQSAG